MGRKMLYLLVTLFVLSAFLSLQELQAAPPYYEGKVINIIVGYSPGGGYDRCARILFLSCNCRLHRGSCESPSHAPTK